LYLVCRKQQLGPIIYTRLHVIVLFVSELQPLNFTTKENEENVAPVRKECTLKMSLGVEGSGYLHV
jgi:hypothetical protein